MVLKKPPPGSTPLRVGGKRVQTISGGTAAKSTGSKGKSAQAPGQLKKKAGVRSARTFTKKKGK